MSILNKIFANKRLEVARAKRDLPEEALAQMAFATPNPLDFGAALRDPSRPAPRLIGEIKRRSPSKGLLRPDLDEALIARAYAANGAAAISILTDHKYFGGSLARLQRVSEFRLGLPLLRKDFIFDRYQLLEARAFGASGVLLIVAMLTENSLAELIHAALEFGLTPLIEVHTQAELETALRTKAPVIGINNRDLHTFKVDLETTRALRRAIPEDVAVVSESGIHTREDVLRLAEAGIQAMLVGESLMTSKDIGQKVRELAQTESVIAPVVGRR
jgi:indole-3-glycerol phosphate synthase